MAHDESQCDACDGNETAGERRSDHMDPKGLTLQEREDAQHRARAALEARANTQRVGHSGGSTGSSNQAQTDDPFLRPANEDDDGYDPYSDRPIKTSQYEEDPWR